MAFITSDDYNEYFKDDDIDPVQLTEQIRNDIESIAKLYNFEAPPDAERQQLEKEVFIDNVNTFMGMIGLNVEVKVTEESPGVYAVDFIGDDEDIAILTKMLDESKELDERRQQEYGIDLEIEDD